MNEISKRCTFFSFLKWLGLGFGCLRLVLFSSISAKKNVESPSLTLSNPTKQTSDDVRAVKSKILDIISYKWGISHLRGSHFPTVVVKAKKPTFPASLAARPHPHDPSSTWKMFLHKALRLQSKWATWGSQPCRIHFLEGVVMVESRLKAAAGALCWFTLVV